MSINEKKCTTLHFGKTNPGLQYFVGSDVLPAACAFRDLGIRVDIKLKFAEHIEFVK